MTPSRKKIAPGTGGPAPQEKSSGSPLTPAQAPAAAEAKLRPATPRKLKTGRTGRPRGGVTVHDWDALRLEYVKGGDEVTLASLSALAGRPYNGTIEKRSARENWAVLRKQFRAEVLRLTMELEQKMQGQVSVAAIAEVRERQAAQAIRMGSLGMELLEEIYSEVDPETGARGQRWRKSGIGTARMLVNDAQKNERAARGMNEYDVNLNDLSSPADLNRYTPEQLIDLLNRRRRAMGMAHSSTPLDLAALKADTP